MPAVPVGSSKLMAQAAQRRLHKSGRNVKAKFIEPGFEDQQIATLIPSGLPTHPKGLSRKDLTKFLSDTLGVRA